MIRPEKHWYPAHYQSHKQTNNKGGRLRNYWKNLRSFYNNSLLLLLAYVLKYLTFCAWSKVCNFWMLQYLKYQQRMMNRINQRQIILSKTYDMVTDQDKNLWTPMGIYVRPL